MYPQTIIDQSIPLLDGSSTNPTGSNTNPVLTDSGGAVPTTHVDVMFPPAIIAQETISQAFNTSTKAIKGAFKFESLGAIQIGEFSQGVSGEIDISPNGIIAKNINGDDTFSIDGTTGDALFRGIVSASGFDIIDENGLISTLNFANTTTSHGVTQAFTTLAAVDLINSAQTFTITRPTFYIITATLPMFLTESAGNTGDAFVIMDIDGATSNQGLAIIRSGNNFAHTYTLIYPVTLSAGTHILKLKAGFNGMTGAPVLNVLEFYMSRIQLGA